MKKGEALDYKVVVSTPEYLVDLDRDGDNDIVVTDSDGQNSGVGWLEKRRYYKYGKWQKDGSSPAYAATGGWIGITDHYWLTALIPGQNEQIQGQYRLTKTPGLNILDANYVGQARTIPTMSPSTGPKRPSSRRTWRSIGSAAAVASARR